MADKQKRVEIYEGPDDRGRYSYALFWWADYHPGHPDGEHAHRERGQHFFGVPPTGLPITDMRRSQ
jgi:hypothetical protein